MTPGYKTSEFWISLVTMLLGAVLASGIIGEGSQWERIIGAAVQVLAALGYTVPRAQLKKAQQIREAVRDAGGHPVPPPLPKPSSTN